MITVPVQTEEMAAKGSFFLLIVLEDENLQRLKEHDPAEVTVSKLGQPWAGQKLEAVHFVYATAEEVQKLMLPQTPEQMMKYVVETLFRGWKFRPETGDHDEAYSSLLK